MHTKPDSKEEIARKMRVLEALARIYEEVTCPLKHDSLVQLLVAVILSAQCTDERVNQVTPALFAQFKDAYALKDAPIETLEQLIYTTGFFRAKARYIKETCRILCERHQGEVPHNMADLLQLKGVARKTANVVLGMLDIREGIVVDTHVKRLSYRLGFTKAHTPEAIEQDLMQQIEKSMWVEFSHRLIMHGRAVCQARKPRCHACVLSADCPRIGL